jgi:DNA-binding GntR family transcriptional regulator
MSRSKKRATGARDTADLSQKAYGGLRRMLFHSDIVPGQKIAYRDLAEQMGMSATPVLQALKFLEFQGLIVRKPNRGYYVKPLSLQEAREIYEFREVVETTLLSHSIGRLEARDRRQLQSGLAAHRAAVNDVYPSERMLRDKEFHLTLAALAHQPIQLQTLQTLFDLLHLRYRAGLLYVTSNLPVDADHQKLFDAFVAGDLKRSQKILGEHIAHVKKHALKSLERMMQEKQAKAF